MEHPLQLDAVQEPHAEEPAEERRSPASAAPLLKPKLDRSFLMFFLPQAVQHSAASSLLRAKYSNFSPQSSHLYS